MLLAGSEIENCMHAITTLLQNLGSANRFCDIHVASAFHACNTSPGTSSRNTMLLAGSEIENCMHATTTVTELKFCK